MFTRRLDPASGDVPRLSPGEEALFVDMIPSLRAVTLGMTSLSRSSSTPEEKDGSVEPMNDGDQEGSDSNTRGDVEEESAVNRQTALLSLDVLARVLGRRHQLAFVGVLDDVTEIVAGKGPNALPGTCCSAYLLPVPPFFAVLYRFNVGVYCRLEIGWSRLPSFQNKKLFFTPYE